MTKSSRLNKKGFSLVESLAAVTIVAILAAGVLSAIVFARVQLAEASARSAAITKAQGVMDVLVSSLSTGVTNHTTLDGNTEATYTASFAYLPSAPCQYSFESSDGNRSFSVTVVSYYQNGEKSVTLTGSAVNTGATFVS